ncbi:MAG TPA: hypothetical protein VLS89_17180, partial [Candidatus Nanopelagicales bacterium]|nr:hypothetical protein [Candidatus Nanopelagicales bacterium]
PPALDLANALIDTIDDEPDTMKVIAWSLDELKATGRRDAAWALAALERPESRRFDIAMRLVGRDSSLPVRSLLQRALESPARNGAAAAEAARHLVWSKAMGPDDPRLDGILERAPLRERGALLGMILLLNARLEGIRRHVADVLTGPDDEAASEAFEDLYCKKPEGTHELLQSVRPLVSAPKVRRSIDYYLGEPNEAELYWRHSSEDEDEDEDEFLD